MNCDPYCFDIKTIIIAHEFVLNKSNKCEYPNGRKCCGAVYCIDGEAEFAFAPKQLLTVKKGDVLLLSQNAAYSIYVKNEFRHYTVNFETDEACVSEQYYLLNSKNPEMYRHIFKKAVAEWNRKSICREMMTLSALYELLALAVSEIYESKYSESSYYRLQPAKEYIEHNFDRNITLGMLANLCNMSVAGFRKEWMRRFGDSAMQYRDNLRLQYAKEYLISGYYSVAETAEKCGFCDVNYFVRFFKKHIGVPPGKYKSFY